MFRGKRISQIEDSKDMLLHISQMNGFSNTTTWKLTAYSHDEIYPLTYN